MGLAGACVVSGSRVVDQLMPCSNHRIPFPPCASSLVDLLDPDEQRPSEEADGNGDVASGRSLKTQMLKDVFWAFGVASEAAEVRQVCPGGAARPKSPASANHGPVSS